MIKIIKTHKTQSRLILFALLVLASFLRLYRIPEYMTFLGDEGRDVLVVMHMIVQHKFTLLGPTASVGGFFLGPIYYYFMLPFLWLWRLDPSGPAYMVAIFGIATVYFIYKTGKEFFNEYVGIVAAGLYSVSPLVLSYSRSSWNPNLVPFFSIMLVYLLRQIATRPSKTLFIFLGIVLGIGLQLHYLFLFLFVLVFIWILLWYRSLTHIRLYISGVIGFLIGYAPFLAFELRHGFPNTNSIYRFLLAGKDTGFSNTQFISNIVDVTFRLFGRLIFDLPNSSAWETSASFKLWILMTGAWSTLLIIFGIFLYYVFHVFKYRNQIVSFQRLKTLDSKSISTLLIFMWLGICVVLFGLYKRAIYDYYLGILFPAPFILFGYLLNRITLFRFGRIISISVFGLLMIINWQARPFAFSPNNQLNQAKIIARAVLDETDGKPFNFALITNFNSDHAYRYFFELWGNTPIPIENTEIDPGRKSVSSQLIVVCEQQDCKPLGHPLWEIAGFGRAQIFHEKTVMFVRIFKLIHYTNSI